MAKETVVVLLSGGWESTLCLLRAVARHGKCRVLPVHYRYGMAHEDAEFLAVSRICDALDITFAVHILPVDCTDQPVVSARNIRMLLDAVDQYAPQEVYVGARAPSPLFDVYGDSNRSTLRAVGKSMGVRVRTLAPLPKWLVRALVARPLHQFIYSTEN